MNSRYLWEAHQDVGDDSSRTKVDLVLPDRPYNVRCKRRMDTIFYDIFTPEDMRDIVELAR